MESFSVAVLLALASAMFPFVVRAATIDFESIPEVGTPTEGLEINTQFLAIEGVTFSLEGGGSPVISKVGAPTTAFLGPPDHTEPDTPAPEQGIGSYFLTDNGTLDNLSVPALIVSYASPTAAASGVILDLDFDESFLIQARTMSGAVLQTIVLRAGDPFTGDGIATPWSFDRGVNDIFSIRFKGSKTAAGGFGLGFDNFSAHVALVPEPTTVAFLIPGLLLVLVGARRSRRVQRCVSADIKMHS